MQYKEFGKDLKGLLLISVNFILLTTLSGQTFNPISFEVNTENKSLNIPWTGGLNSPQFNSIDLNGDAIKDLLVFDRAGNVILPFVNKNIQGESTWQYAPEYLKRFPNLTDWVIVKDYNQDGIDDLLAYSDVPGVDGIQVFKGAFENDSISFNRINFEENFNLVYFALPNGGRAPLRVSKIDYPAIEDIDCDGDLDILTFNVGGGQIELFKNLSIERGFGTDTLIFQIVDFCWGGIFESGFTKEIDLASSSGDCASNFENAPPISVRHAGSTILAFDADDDGDRDLILGDLSFGNLNFLTNSGDCETAWISDQDIDFPSYDVPVDIPSFPASFLLDVDNDGLKDLIVAPNLARGVENFEVSWWYKNTMSNENPQFSLQNKRFLADQMLDFGERSHPTFVDVNADGLLDIVVGIAGVFKGFGQTEPALILLLNRGTPEQPAFEIVDRNYLLLRNFNTSASNFTPAFGDLDGDGDLDLLVGEDLGGLYYAENLAGPGQPMQFGQWTYPYAAINVGLASSPQIFDLNEDGLNDIIVGEQNGNLNYFQNMGDANNPSFLADQNESPNNAFLGKVDARIPGFVFGTSQPHFFKEDGITKLLLGTENGQIELYSNIQNNLEGTFTLENEYLGKLKEGFKTTPFLADIDKDQIHELIMGNERGGLALYQTPFKSAQTTSQELVSQEKFFTVFPNPTNSSITITLEESFNENNSSLELYSLDGRIQLLKKGLSENEVLDLDHLIPGVYLLKIHSDRKVWSEKVILF